MSVVHLCISASVVARDRDRKVHAVASKHPSAAQLPWKESPKRRFFLFFFMPHIVLLSLGVPGGGRHLSPDTVACVEIGTISWSTIIIQSPTPHVKYFTIFF